MQKKSETFGITFDNIPMINLRNEFSEYYNLLLQPEFRERVKQHQWTPIDTGYFTWYARPSAFLTLVLQKAIFGIESYIVGAVHCELGMRGKLNSELLTKLKDPTNLPGKNMVEKYYRSLPALIEPNFGLKGEYRPLWKSTTRFYLEVRNPLMHGYEIDPRSVDGVYKAFEHLAKLYKWIDSWHNLLALFNPVRTPVRK